MWIIGRDCIDEIGCYLINELLTKKSNRSHLMHAYAFHELLPNRVAYDRIKLSLLILVVEVRVQERHDRIRRMILVVN